MMRTRTKVETNRARKKLQLAQPAVVNDQREVKRVEEQHSRQRESLTGKVDWNRMIVQKQ
jgi:hypothetical protein